MPPKLRDGKVTITPRRLVNTKYFERNAEQRRDRYSLSEREGGFSSSSSTSRCFQGSREGEETENNHLAAPLAAKQEGCKSGARNTKNPCSAGSQSESNANVGVQVEVKGPRPPCYATAAATARAVDAFQPFCFVFFFNLFGRRGSKQDVSVAAKKKKGL